MITPEHRDAVARVLAVRPTWLDEARAILEYAATDPDVRDAFAAALGLEWEIQERWDPPARRRLVGPWEDVK